LISQAKGLLEKVIKQRVSGVTVVRSLAEEKKAILKRRFPLAALITNPGAFDGNEARTLRYFDKNEKHKFNQRYVRGNRNLPVLIRCWASSEAEADAAFSRIIPAIPSRWVYDNFTGSIEIGTEEHSDHSGNVTALYLSVIDVTFTAAAAMEPGELPYFEEVVLQSAEMAKPK